MIEEMKLNYLKSLSIFRNFQDKQLEQIAQAVKIRQLVSGEVINYGSATLSKIYFVVSGKIKVAEINDVEDELIKDILNGGEIFGDLELEGDSKNYEFAEALMDNTIICSLGTTDFINLLRTYPETAIIYAKKVSMKLKRLEDRYSDLMLLNVRSRLVRFMKNWATIEGSKIGDKVILQNYLTHSDIAGIISTSRQTVSILFKEMKDSGLLHYNRKLIQLNDPTNWN